MVASVFASTSAQIALQTLRSTNRQLEDVNNEISTGRKVSTAKDNAAIFAISKLMESDVATFQAVNESISLGSATLSVASAAANSVGDLLNEVRAKVVLAQASGADTATLQNEISSLTAQITSIVDSAQFNGLNLIDGSTTSFDVLGSVSRDSSGNVSTGQISLDTAVSNLTATNGLVLDNFDGGGGSAVTVAGAAAGTDQTATPGGFDNTGSQVVQAAGTVTVTMANITAGASGGAASTSEATAAELVDQTALLEGDMVAVTVGSVRGVYNVREGDSLNDIAAGIRTSLVDAGIDTTAFTVGTAGGDLTIENNGALEVRVDVDVQRGSGGLSALQSLSVTSAGDAATALGTVDSLIATTTTAQAAIGTAQKRLEIQQDFTSSMIDSFKSGIGSLVDADLNESAARLQALQVQQRLGVESLAIANQAPMNVLALFR
ncbi:MAG: flagellin [Pseudomonadota bacterium]